jgi:hypothetical protein
MDIGFGLFSQGELTLLTIMDEPKFYYEKSKNSAAGFALFS